MDTRRNWLLVCLAASSIAASGCSPGRASGDSPTGTTNSTQTAASSAPVGLSSANSTASASVAKPMVLLRKPLASVYWNGSIWLAGAELDKNRIVVARARAEAGFVEPETIAATIEVDQLPKSVEIFVGHGGLSLLSQGDGESDPQRLYHFALHEGRLEAMGKPLLLEAYASVCATEDGVVFMELVPDATKAQTISMVPRRGRFRFAPFAHRRNAERFTIRTLAENQLETRFSCGLHRVWVNNHELGVIQISTTDTKRNFFPQIRYETPPCPTYFVPSADDETMVEGRITCDGTFDLGSWNMPAKTHLVRIHGPEELDGAKALSGDGSIAIHVQLVRGKGDYVAIAGFRMRPAPADRVESWRNRPAAFQEIEATIVDRMTGAPIVPATVLQKREPYEKLAKIWGAWRGSEFVTMWTTPDGPGYAVLDPKQTRVAPSRIHAPMHEGAFAGCDEKRCYAIVTVREPLGVFHDAKESAAYVFAFP